jgi:hypothetical protein
MTDTLMTAHTDEDRDLALVLDLLSGQLSADAEREVLARMDRDPAFRALAGSMIDAWTAPVDWHALGDSVEREAAARAPAPARATPAPRLRRAPAWAVRVLQTAAALVLMTGATLMGAGYSGMAGAHEMAMMESRGARPAAAPSTRVTTTALTRERITLAGGSTVALGPSSRFVWRVQRNWPHGVIASLKGEAVIVVTAAERVVFLGTDVGGVVLRPGTYAVRCALACTRLEVSVGAAGTAWLKGDTPTAWLYWPLGRGEHATIGDDGLPERTTGYQYLEAK